MKIIENKGFIGAVLSPLDTLSKTGFNLQAKVTVQEKNIGKGCPVYLLEKFSGKHIATTETDSESFVYFPNLSKNKNYIIFATDIYNDFNTVCYEVLSKDNNFYFKNTPYKTNKNFIIDNNLSSFSYFYPNYNELVLSDSVVFNSILGKDNTGFVWLGSGDLSTTVEEKIPFTLFKGTSSNTYINATPTQASKPFTFECFIKPYKTFYNKNFISGSIFTQELGTNLSQNLTLTEDGRIIFNRNSFRSFSNITLESNSKISEKNITHVALVFDTFSLKLFINGVLDNEIQDTIGMVYNNSLFRIGLNFYGLIGVPTFYNTAKYLDTFEVDYENFSYKNYIQRVDKKVLETSFDKEASQLSIKDTVGNSLFNNSSTTFSPYSLILYNNMFTTSAPYPKFAFKGDMCVEMYFRLNNLNGADNRLFGNYSEATKWVANDWCITYNQQNNTYAKDCFYLHINGLSNNNNRRSSNNIKSKEPIVFTLNRKGNQYTYYINGQKDTTFSLVNNLDNKNESYFSIGNTLSLEVFKVNIYNGDSVYEDSYTPLILEDEEAKEKFYKILELPFKKTLTDFNSSLSLVLDNVYLSQDYSSYNTRSARFSKTSFLSLENTLYNPVLDFTVEFKFLVTVEQDNVLFKITENLFLKIDSKKLFLVNEDLMVELTEIEMEIFNHISIQREEGLLKVLLNGTLKETLEVSLEDTINITLGGFEGFVNNFYIYKGLSKYPDSYVVIEDPDESTPPTETGKEPEVVVNDYTTSALDFENGLVDKIPTTIWQKSGTADVTSDNKIFGENSFETKALGDSLYTESNVITGGSTPFTIEFYALIKGSFKGSSGSDSLPLFSKSGNVGRGDQYVGLLNKKILGYLGGGLSNKPFNYTSQNGYSIQYNDVNKYTVTYDGSAFRYFINDVLNLVIGSSVGWLNSPSNPFKFFDNVVTNYEEYRLSTKGIVDNINIHDGIATKVRDYDPYEEYLIVDLAFDGENNSTKIVDNGIKTEDIFYGNVLTLLNFTNGIDDAKDNIYTTTSGSPTFETTSPIYENQSLKITSRNNTLNLNWNQNNNLSNNDFTIEFSVKPMGTSGTYSAMMSSRTYGSVGNNWCFLWNGGKPSVQLNTTNGSVSLTATTTMVMNNVYHIALVRKNNTIKLFINGVVEAVSEILHSILDVQAPINIGKLDGGTSSDNCVYGLYDNIRITKGVARYENDYIVSTTKFWKHNKWTVNGNAKISTDQKFDGFSSLYLDGSSHVTTKFSDAFNFIGSVITLSFEFIPTNLATTVGQQQILIASWDSSNNTRSFFILIEKESTGHSIQFGISQDGLAISNPIKFNVILTNNVRYKIYLIISNNVTLYLNGNIVNSFKNNYIQQYVSNVSMVGVGSHLNNSSRFIGYIKNFKIYKGVAVIPEDPTGKIQLDFDNNVIDKYGNSTWTNNGVTFDQVNSVKGHTAYFKRSANSYISCANNENLNFQKLPFKLSFDASIDKYNPSGWQDYICSGLSNSSPNNVSGLFYNNINKQTRLRLDRNNYFEVSTTNILNQYYNHNLSRTNNVFLYKINNVIQIAVNWVNDITYNWNNITRLGTASTGADEYLTGKMDNFKSEKDYKGEVLIDQPAVHLPLETNATNIGFTPLTINSVGNPTYHVIDGKKCIKFESGKYLTINSNNIFSLGENSDFYIEFDFYPHSYRYQTFIVDNVSGFRLSSSILSVIDLDGKIYFRNYLHNQDVVLLTSKAVVLNSWNKFIFKRVKDKLYMILNNTVDEFPAMPVDFSKNGTLIGTAPWQVNNFADNMSNFKMFVGTSEIPETYNDKKVLDLDFAPPLNEDGSRASYLFKDNNNKCVIHPVNINYRDYQDSQYCCTFNGVDQYLQLGKNDLLNFGLDDFIFNLKFIIKDMNRDNNMIIAAGGTTSGRSYIGVGGTNINELGYRNKLIMSNTGGLGIFASKTIIQKDTLYDITIVRRENMYLELYINGVLDISVTNWVIDPSKTIKNTNFNFNLNNNTYIATAESTVNLYFNGTIYSIKILRNTSDLSLLE